MAFSIESNKCSVTKPVISHKPLHVTAIWLQIWQIHTILNSLTKCLIFCNLIPLSFIQCKNTIFPICLLLFQVFELSMLHVFSSVTNQSIFLHRYAVVDHWLRSAEIYSVYLPHSILLDFPSVTSLASLHIFKVVTSTTTWNNYI